MRVRCRQARTTLSASHMSPSVKRTVASPQKEPFALAMSAWQANTHSGRKSIPSALQQKRDATFKKGSDQQIANE